MTRHVLMTGATGALGPYVLAQMLRAGVADRVTVLLRGPQASERFDELLAFLRTLLSAESFDAADHVTFVEGDVTLPRLGMDASTLDGLRGDVNILLHQAADTRFRAPIEELRKSNLTSTANVIDLARSMPHRDRLILISTTCVAGCATGRINEAPIDQPAAFVNGYEESKWEAEQLALASGLPVRIVRLATVIGQRDSGFIRRIGAWHQALKWMHRGLIPMAPCDAGARVDILSTEKAAHGVACAVGTPVSAAEVWHIASGDASPAVQDLIDTIAERFRAHHHGWRVGQISAPLLVDRATFELFRHSVVRSKDALFSQVLESVSSFLPGLLYPKVVETSRAEAACGPMREDWRPLVSRVVDWCLQSEWGRARSKEVAHA